MKKAFNNIYIINCKQIIEVPWLPDKFVLFLKAISMNNLFIRV